MSYDYRQCSLEELLDTYENVDRENYPEAYKRICEEIAYRKQKGELTDRDLELREASEDFLYRNHRFNVFEELDSYYHFSEYDESGSSTTSIQLPKQITRGLIAVFVIVNIALLALILPNYWVPALEDVHKYSAMLDSVRCKKERIFEDDDSYMYYHLLLESQQHQFSAFDIHPSKCQAIARRLSPEEKVDIWHEDGLIYQLEFQNIKLLPYDYLKTSILGHQTSDIERYWILLIIANSMLLFGYFKLEELNSLRKKHGNE